MFASKYWVKFVQNDGSHARPPVDKELLRGIAVSGCILFTPLDEETSSAARPDVHGVILTLIKVCSDAGTVNIEVRLGGFSAPFSAIKLERVQRRVLWAKHQIPSIESLTSDPTCIVLLGRTSSDSLSPAWYRTHMSVGQNSPIILHLRRTVGSLRTSSHTDQPCKVSW